ncbi:staygreen family protein [Clostridiaceae bacterium 35-E11]
MNRERLDPEKVFVELRHGVALTKPIVGRKYTLTHSDTTAELFLTIGLQYAYDKINPRRDEVLAAWCVYNNMLIMYVYVYVDGAFGYDRAAIRNQIFIRELPLALEAIRYGDRTFFGAHPDLDKCPIFIYFDSTFPCLNRVEYWGMPSDYNKSKEK